MSLRFKLFFGNLLTELLFQSNLLLETDTKSNCEVIEIVKFVFNRFIIEFQTDLKLYKFIEWK